MRRRGKQGGLLWRVVGVCLGLLMAGAARGEDTAGSLAVRCTRILLVRLDKVSFTPDAAMAARGSSQGKMRLEFTVEEALKGAAAPGAVEEDTYNEYATGFESGERLLLCLDEGRQDDQLGGQYVLSNVKDMGGLLTPRYDRPVYTEDLRPLATAELIVALRAELARPHRATQIVGTPYHLEYPEGDDEPSTINLADDERVAGIVDGWLGSPHPRCRLFAVDLLAGFIRVGMSGRGLSA